MGTFFRVTNNAIEIAKYEEADIYICELAALLHDIADGRIKWKRRSWPKKGYIHDLVDNGVSGEARSCYGYCVKDVI